MRRNNKQVNIFTVNNNAFIGFIKTKNLELPFGKIYLSHVEPVDDLTELPQFIFVANNRTTAELGFFLVKFDIEKLKGKTIDSMSAQMLVRNWLVGLQEYYLQEHGHALDFLENGPHSLNAGRIMSSFGGVIIPSAEDLEKSQKAALDGLARALFESMQHYANPQMTEPQMPRISVTRRATADGKMPFQIEAMMPGLIRVTTSSEPFSDYMVDDYITGKIFFAGQTYNINFQHYALQTMLGKFVSRDQLRAAFLKMWTEFTVDLNLLYDQPRQAIELTFDSE